MELLLLLFLLIVLYVLWKVLSGDSTPTNPAPPAPQVILKPLTDGEFQALVAEMKRAVAWKEACDRVFAHAKASARWITAEQINDLEMGRPGRALWPYLSQHNLQGWFSAAEVHAAWWSGTDLQVLAKSANEDLVKCELINLRHFFDRIERTPLTEEQARAVISFDNRVHLLAAAGSGKTSVMVARAAYAVARGFVAPDKILMLAFNHDAAVELQERVKERFAAAGLPSDGIKASTFHSFGLEYLGKATGSKPRVAPWVGSEDRSIKKVLEIVNGLKRSDPTFARNWDLYRLVFASAPLESNGSVTDSYDRTTRKVGFGTLDGKVVKSFGERMIADWLFLNNVEYEYERPYTTDLSSAEYSQYHPDFYYPRIDVWHEHWGLDRDGKPPKEFSGYLEQMRWKQATHSRLGTTLIESTYHSIVNGDGLAALERELRDRGISPRWEPNRKGGGQRYIPQDERFAGQIRRFMSHVKSNGLTRTDLVNRLRTTFGYLAGTRTAIFLDVYWKIHDAWDAELRAKNYVDFDDMLLSAATQLETGRHDPGYELVLVDEFQDVSHARARLIRGLLAAKGRYLLAVGDDWQSINAFAGSDLAIVSSFESWFGKGPQLSLGKTFRCTQTICDVASSFVQKNPAQLTKTVTAARGERGEPVRVVLAADPRSGVAAILKHISERVSRGEIVPGSGSKVTVMVLGRYNYVSEDVPQRTPNNLDVQFLTAHRSKGLEADVVIVARVIAGRMGFPSEIEDDPVLTLAMAMPDMFPDAEERRLLYVALTRARQMAILVSSDTTPSRFVSELIAENGAEVLNVNLGGVEKMVPCSKCGQGAMVTRTGPYGAFLGCSRFPACVNTGRL